MELVDGLTRTELAYAAGLFDGEGSIQISVSRHSRTGKPYHWLQVSVGNTDPRAVLWLRERFQGRIQASRLIAGRRPYSRWITSAASAERFLRAIRPYLLIKAEQAEVALEFHSTLRRPGRSGHRTIDPVTPDVLQRRQDLKRRLSALKAEVRSG